MLEILMVLPPSGMVNTRGSLLSDTVSLFSYEENSLIFILRA